VKVSIHVRVQVKVRVRVQVKVLKLMGRLFDLADGAVDNSRCFQKILMCHIFEVISSLRVIVRVRVRVRVGVRVKDISSLRVIVSLCPIGLVSPRHCQCGL